VAEESVKVHFPRLILISEQKESSVSEMMVRDGSEAMWVFNWRGRLFVWERS
jgi:hypothetical protein